MTYIMKCKTGSKNNVEEAGPFYVHFTGGAGVRKSLIL